MEDYKELYEKLLAEFNQYKLESIKWSVSDFTSFELDEWQISDDQAQAALEEMIRKHDCNYGIGWIDVREYLQEYGEKVPLGFERWRVELIKEQKSCS